MSPWAGSPGNNATTGSNNVYIGAGMEGVAGESNACYIGSIFGQLSSVGTTVYINPDGKLGTTLSSRRFKDDIKPMDNSSDVILALKPVTFHYKKDPKGIPQFGLVAEDVEAINSDLVIRDKEGQVNTVRYDAINAMLLNEFLKEHKKVEELQAARITEQKEIAELKQQLKALASSLEKVSAQVELSKPAPRTVTNEH